MRVYWQLAWAEMGRGNSAAKWREEAWGDYSRSLRAEGIRGPDDPEDEGDPRWMDEVLFMSAWRTGFAAFQDSDPRLQRRIDTVKIRRSDIESSERAGHRGLYAFHVVMVVRGEHDKDSAFPSYQLIEYEFQQSMQRAMLDIAHQMRENPRPNYKLRILTGVVRKVVITSGRIF